MIPANPFAQAPLRPNFNVGALFDIQTGRYMTGKHGESILNGGLAHFTGVAGRAKTFKTAISFYMLLQVIDRYAGATAGIYDTEMTATMERVHELAKKMPRIGGKDLQETGQVTLSNRTQYTGTQWFDLLKEFMKMRRENAKDIMLTTPFLDKEGKNIKIMAPYISEVDSFSMFAADVVLNLQDKGGVGDSERNVEAMRDAASKTQMLMELPTLTAQSSLYVILTSHAGDGIQMDPYKPNPKKMTFLKQDLKLKNTPEKFTFLPNNVWLATGSTVMINQSTKTVEFPRNSDDDLKGDTDLMAITMINLRGNAGPSGIPFEVVVSQSEGLLPGLTNFLYIKQCDRFGIGGNDRNYFLELLPDVTLSRTTVRGKIEQNEKLRRALEITAEMCQIQELWHNLEDKYRCTPKQLFDEIKAKGYDWDVLLNTRGYWVFEEDKHPLPFLSTMDLLKMRVDEYRPYWLDKGK